MEALVSLLSRERVLVDMLVFKLVSLRQLLLAGETRFLPWAAEEVERATGAVRDAELERALLTAALGADRGLEEASLSSLVDDAPEPWRALLQDAHSGLRRGAAEVQDLMAVTRRLAEVGVRSMAEAMGEEAPVPAYGHPEKVAAHRYQTAL